MAGIPTYERQEALNPLPSARIQNHATAASFGAGVASAGNQFIAAGLQMAQDYEHAQALSALNEYQKQVDKLHLDPDTGLYNTRKLGNANGMTMDSEEQMKELASKIYGELKSPYMKKVFAEQSQKIAITQSRANQKWEAAQIQAYKDQETESAINNCYNRIALYYNDEEQIQLIRDQMAPHIEYQLRGLGEEARENALMKFESNIATIQAAKIIENDPMNAVSWVEQNKDRFDPQIYEKVHNQAETKAEPYIVEAERDAILKKFGNNEAAAHKYIQENYEGEREKKIMTAVEAEYSDRRRIKNQQEADWLDYMRNGIASAGSYSAAIAMINRGGGQPQHRKYLENYAKSVFGVSTAGSSSGESPFDKVKVISAIQTWASDPANLPPDATPEQRLEAYKRCMAYLVDSNILDGLKIKPSTVESLLQTHVYNKKFSSQKGTAGGTDKPFYNASSLDEVRQLVKDAKAGMSVEDGISCEDALQRNLQDAIIAYTEKNGREPSNREIYDMAKEILSPIVAGSYKGFFGTTHDVQVSNNQAKSIESMNEELRPLGREYRFNAKAGMYICYETATDKPTGDPGIPIW